MIQTSRGACWSPSARRHTVSGMDESSITTYIAGQFEGVDVAVGSREAGSPEVSWGDTFFIYDPNRDLEGPRRFPFATIVTKDYGEFDDLSDLDRPGIFRLNIGVSEASITSKPVFGQMTEFVNGNMVAAIYGEELMVRLSAGEIAEVKKQGGRDFEPMPGRKMGGYVVVPGDWRATPPTPLIKRALEETRKMPAKAPRKKR